MLASTVVLWVGLVFQNEGCPEYTIIEELQVEYFMGKWYEQYTTVEEADDCGLLDITIGSSTYMNVSQSYINLENDTKSELHGRVRWPQPPYGHLQLKFGKYQSWVNYDILETDYSNYAVMYSCQTTWLGAQTE